jgi:hypothetical protein
LLLVSERYPELKANQNFLSLQAQLEGTENRISVERGNFNKTVQDYNVAVRSFPTNLIAGMLGFPPRPFFTAQPGAEKPPPCSSILARPLRRPRPRHSGTRMVAPNSAVRILGSARARVLVLAARQNNLFGVQSSRKRARFRQHASACAPQQRCALVVDCSRSSRTLRRK